MRTSMGIEWSRTLLRPGRQLRCDRCSVPDWQRSLGCWSPAGTGKTRLLTLAGFTGSDPAHAPAGGLALPDDIRALDVVMRVPAPADAGSLMRCAPRSACARPVQRPPSGEIGTLLT